MPSLRKRFGNIFRRFPTENDKFHHLMEMAREVATHDTRGYIDLIKLILRPLQSEYWLSNAEAATGQTPSGINRDSFFVEARAPQLFIEEKPVPVTAHHTLDISRDIIFTTPWDRDCLAKALALHGPEKKRGRWQQKDNNHDYVLWLPWRIAFADRGNHSLVGAALNGGGTAVPREVYDFSHVLNRVHCDGKHYFDTSTGKPIAQVRDYRKAAVFEIGRLIAKQPLNSQ